MPALREFPTPGSLITGTYCSRIFTDCDKNVCRLQSPNYPGVYPRNLTCYYAVRQVSVINGRTDAGAMRPPVQRAPKLIQ